MTGIVVVHVGAGAAWVLSSMTIALTRRAGQWLLASQIAAALIVITAGIDLWGARHAGPQGPTEHWLTLGTVASFIAFGLQIGIAGSVAMRGSQTWLESGALVLYRASALFLVLAALAMIASLYR